MSSFLAYDNPVCPAVEKKEKKTLTWNWSSSFCQRCKQGIHVNFFSHHFSGQLVSGESLSCTCLRIRLCSMGVKYSPRGSSSAVLFAGGWSSPASPGCLRSSLGSVVRLSLAPIAFSPFPAPVACLDIQQRLEKERYNRTVLSRRSLESSSLGAILCSIMWVRGIIRDVGFFSSHSTPVAVLRGQSNFTMSSAFLMSSPLTVSMSHVLHCSYRLSSCLFNHLCSGSLSSYCFEATVEVAVLLTVSQL